MEDNKHNSFQSLIPEYRMSLVDISFSLFENRRIVVKTMLIFFMAGLGYSILKPDYYRVRISLIKETRPEKNNIVGGMSLLTGLGMNLSSPVGMNEKIYPVILRSAEILVPVSNQEYSIAGYDQPVTFQHYFENPVNWSSRLIKFGLKYSIGLFRSSNSSSSAKMNRPEGEELHNLSDNQILAINKLSRSISISIDRETGLIYLTVSSKDPMLSAELGRQLIAQLRIRVNEIFVNKYQDNVNFIKERFAEAAKDLEIAEDQLADFIDKNQNPATAQLRTKLDRYKLQVEIRAKLYIELQTQLTMEEMELQRNSPVISLLEAAILPREASGPNRPLIIFLSIIIGFAVGSLIVALKQLIVPAADDPDEQEKLKAMQNYFFRTAK